jgi:hypothetical protein
LNDRSTHLYVVRTFHTSCNGHRHILAEDVLQPARHCISVQHQSRIHIRLVVTYGRASLTSGRAESFGADAFRREAYRNEFARNRLHEQRRSAHIRAEVVSEWFCNVIQHRAIDATLISDPARRGLAGSCISSAVVYPGGRAMQSTGGSHVKIAA